MTTKTNYVLVMMTEAEADALAASPIPRGQFTDGAQRKRAMAALEKVKNADVIPADPATIKRALAKLSGR